MLSESVLRRRYAENGFWERGEGTLLIWHDDELVGHIESSRRSATGTRSSSRTSCTTRGTRATLEGTVRGAFFNGGRNHDVLLYSLLRTDPRPWHARVEALAAVPDA